MSDMLNGSYETFLSALEGKKCILFGAGGVAQSVIKDLSDKIIFSYVIDNNFWLWGNEFLSYTVYPPNALLQEDPENVIVLVAISDIFAAQEQLEDLGIKHVFHYPLFFEHLQKTYKTIRIRFIFNN